MTDVLDSYQASPAKRRRATKAEVADRREQLIEIVEAMKPMTVRQVFYQATVRGIVEKSEAGYTKVQTDLVLMRRAGDLPYDWLADNTRWQRKPRTYNGVQEALEETARFYRKNSVGGRLCLCRVLAGKGRPGWRRLSDHVDVRRSAHGGAWLRESVFPAHRRRVHQ